MILTCAGSGSDGNCYLLKDSEGKMLLLEAGVTIDKIKKLIGYNVMDLEGCLITHHHKDHSASVVKLRMMGVKTFMPYELDEWRKEVIFGNFKVKAFPLTDSAGKFVHTNGDGTECPVFGFLIEHEEMGKMVYFTDCEFCRWMFRKKKLNHMLLGVNYQEQYAPLDEAKMAHVIGGHLSETTASDFIRVNQTEHLQNIVLGHLSEFSCNPEELLMNISKVAETGVHVEIATPQMELELRKDCPFG